jgi:transcriptional regulator GlxA family with amidase domain
MTFIVEKLPNGPRAGGDTQSTRQIDPHPVRVLVFPDFLLLDATGPVQVFSTGNDESLGRGCGTPYAIELVSLAGGEVRSSSGIVVLTASLPPVEELCQSTLIVAGGAGIGRALGEPVLIDWIAKAGGRVKRCASVCTGAFLLAEAGILRHRRATTHWKDADSLRRLYPDVLVDDDAIFVKDGPVYTSAGITAGLDLCLNLVEEDLGRVVALSVAKQLVMYHQRPGGQRQFSSELLAVSGESDLLVRLVQWLRLHIHEPIDVDRMADAVAVSGRSLHRRLRLDAGLSPAQLLVRVRMETACNLLETGSHSIKQVAHKSGFGTEYNLRHAFARHLGVLPTEYRERFG